MLLVPLPAALIDLLIVLNLAVSILLLVVSLYVEQASSLLAFPSILLLTTLFRLGLNVASTRLILLEGYAGEVIQSFGMFLVRGEVVVGLIIFLIITLVNFIVVAKGASRIAEVSARFALDALPGKQMAIDSDLRSGLINTQEARLKREELRKESQLYGSMDGAMRFVQGDVIAGMFIIVVNILGGMYRGVSQGMPLSEALQNYTILTVGDGLVSQIPALLISISAGMIVTRVASDESSTLGMDITKQLFSKPIVMVIAGVLLLMISLMPNVPTLPFVSVSLGFFSLAYFGSKIKTSSRKILGSSMTQIEVSVRELQQLPFERPRIAIVLDAAVLYRLYLLGRQRYVAFWRDLQNNFQQSVGLRLPDLNVLAEDGSQSMSYQLIVGGSSLERGILPLDCLMVEMNQDSAELFGLECVKEDQHPLHGSAVTWVANTPSARHLLSEIRVASYDFLEVLALRLSSFLLRSPEELLRLSEVHAIVQEMSKNYPGLVSEVIEKKLIDIPRLTELLQVLVREGLSISDIRMILEAVAAFQANQRFQAAEDEGDLEDLVEFVRHYCRRQLVSGLINERGTIKVVTLAPQVEELCENLIVAGDRAQISQIELTDRLKIGLDNVLGPVRQRGAAPLTLLVRNDLKSVVQRFARRYNQYYTPIISPDEIDPALLVERVQVWSA